MEKYLQYIHVKDIACFFIGALGSLITLLYGGWTKGMELLATIMVLDVITGMIVSGVFKKSPKTLKGALKSDVGIKGIFKKVLIAIAIAVLHLIDIFLEKDFLMNLGIIGFFSQEVVSIVENIGLVIELPPIVAHAIEILNEKANGGLQNENK